MKKKHARVVGTFACVLSCSFPQTARGATDPAAPIDRTVVRFYSPETGGTAYPRFILERTLAFEARLADMAEVPDGIGESYDDRDVREALEHHVAEEILASLADKLIADSAPDRRPTTSGLAAVARDVGSAFVERMGGRDRIDGAAHAEGIEAKEVDAILRRGAMAAWYIDHAVSPLLHPGEEQLREVFRSSDHPYRGQPFERVRSALERWFVIERVRVAESAFLQSARSRVRIIVIP
ncbi:MAG: hypothetical protein M3O46_07700 [Myxococcota bacterium]|nr:hypothetical protein [Myxococcota bacterium]